MKELRRMFYDDALHKEFMEKGYVKIPLLSESEVDDLQEYYQQHFFNRKIYMPGYEDMEYTLFSVFHMRPEFRKEIYEKVTLLIMPRLKGILIDCKPLVGNYIAKYPGKGVLDVHQNVALVDEKKFISLSVWCPLQDTNDQNGTLYFIPGTHLTFRGYRSPVTHRPFLRIQDHLVKNYMVPVDVKKGEALILDDAIIHYSDINHTDRIRLTAHVMVVPNEATPIFIEDEAGGRKLNIYQIDETYFHDMGQIHARDKGKFKKIDVADVEMPVLSRGNFNRKLNGLPVKLSLLDRWRAYWDDPLRYLPGQGRRQKVGE